MPVRLIAAVGIVGLLGFQVAAWGQGTTSSSGMFGQRSLGGGISGGTRTLGGSSGGMGMGGSGGIGQNMPTNVGQVDASDRFVRGNRRAGQFVGGNAQDAMQNFIGALQGGATGMQGIGSLGRGGNRATGVNQPGRGGGRGQTEIRSSLHVAFNHPKPALGPVNKKLADRVARLCRFPKPFELEVRVDQGTAILRGVVATSRDRALAERVIHLEPGIWRVSNELLVAAAAPVPPPVPPDRPSAPKVGAAEPDRPAEETPADETPADTLVLPEPPGLEPAGSD